MSIETMAIVLHHSTAKGTDKLVLLGIANHAGDGGAWPAVATLAKYANVNVRAVRASLTRLVNAGELIVHRQQGGTATMQPWERPNRYDVTVACPITCDRTAQHRLRDLPRTAADHAVGLWIEGVSSTTGGVGNDRGGDVGNDTRTVHSTTQQQVVPEVQDTREVGHGALTPPELTPEQRAEAADRLREQLRLGQSRRRAARAARGRSSDAS